jgi:hypothetical protein
VERSTTRCGASATDVLVAEAAQVLARAEALQRLSERAFGPEGRGPTASADAPDERAADAIRDPVCRLMDGAQALAAEALLGSLRWLRTAR